MDANGSFIVITGGAAALERSAADYILDNSTGQLSQLNYSSTKAALTLWPKILPAEFHLRKIGIRVAGIAPGYTAPEILTGMNQDELKSTLKDVHIARLN